MLVFGSSEFRHGIKTKYHPKSVFENQNVSLMLIGGPYNQCLNHAITLGAVENKIQKKKVVLLVSPSWFYKSGVTPDRYSLRFSESNYMALMENKKIPKSIKRYVAARSEKLLSTNDSMQQRVKRDDRIFVYGQGNAVDNLIYSARKAYVTDKDYITVNGILKTSKIRKLSEYHDRITNPEAIGWSGLSSEAIDSARRRSHNEFFMAILVINGKGIPNAAKLVEMMDDAITDLEPAADGMEYSLESVVTITDKSGSFGDSNIECITLAGKPTILEMIGDMQFEISPTSFYQVNPVQMKRLYDKAAEYADLHGGETVLDLYCGVGAIGLYLIKDIPDARVIGIESVKSSVLDANRNAVINHIVNARYVCGRAEYELPKLLSGEGLNDESLLVDHVDVVILDPPRAGCDERLLTAVAEAEPSRIVYVSCDPATLARDIKYLCANGYEFVEATPVDQFSWTGHVETCCLMEKTS